MKIKILILFYFVFINNFIFSNENTINNFNNNNDINIGLGFDEIPIIRINLKASSSSQNKIGYIIIKNGQISSIGNGTFILIVSPSYKLKADCVEIMFSRSYVLNLFDFDRNLLNLSFPEKFKIEIPYKKLLDSEKSIDIALDTTQTYPTTCQAIVIDNLNIRDTPSLSGKKIGMLSKVSEVTLYEQCKNQEEIDGEKNFWYKVKVNEETYGWVYGAYVRIFFEAPSLGYSDKEKILKSLETL